MALLDITDIDNFLDTSNEDQMLLMLRDLAESYLLTILRID
jgi:hypothetical protein